MTEKIKFARILLLDAVSYMTGLLSNVDVKKSRDFSYFLNRNTKMLRDHYELAVGIHEGMQNPEYEEYLQGIKAIHNKHAAKRENGEIIRASSGWPICENSKARDEECKAWNDAHKEDLIRHETRINETMEMLHVEEEYEIFPIDLEKVPEDVDISPMDMFIRENLDLYKPTEQKKEPPEQKKEDEPESKPAEAEEKKP